MKSGIQNSHIETLLGLTEKMLADLSVPLVSLERSFRAVPYDAEDAEFVIRKLSRDFATVKRRVKHEGVEYLTITLPRLGKWLDQMLNSGKFLPRPEGFHPYDEMDYPVFLSVFWKYVKNYFDVPSRYAGNEDLFLCTVRKVRSFLFAFYKLEVPTTARLMSEAYAKFVESDAVCGILWSKSSQAIVNEAAKLLDISLAGKKSNYFDPYDIRPSHGPGAVATGEKLEKKWEFSHLYSSLHQQYPYYDYMYGCKENGNVYHLRDFVSRYRSMVRNMVPTSKVVAVPKDSRGPRIICVEPLEYQFIQQGVAKKLVSHIENSDIFAGHINFSDQTVNQKLALAGSENGYWATIDLKDASDMVSLELFNAVWPKHLLKAFHALRTSHAALPSGEVVHMKKFAPMGSALCFPVESTIFYACCVGALMTMRNLSFNVARQLVYVYGDDIIVPTEHVHAVIRGLEDVGLIVNSSKCCYESSFRESCGVDACLGRVITPQRVRKLPGQRPSDGIAHKAWLAYAANFYAVGMPQAAMYCYRHVCNVFGREIPITEHETSYLSAVIPDLAWSLEDYPEKTWDANLQSWTAKLITVVEKRRRTTLSSWDRLNRNLLMPVEDCDPDEVVVPKATKTRIQRSVIYASSRVV